MAENNFEEIAKDVLNTKDSTSSFDKSDIEDNKIMGILAYIFFLFLVPLFAAPNSKFAKFHANQGCVLFILEVLFTVVTTVLGFAIGWIPVVGAIVCWAVGVVLGVSCLALMILGIINAATGKAKELPIIGKIKLIK